MTTSTSTVIPSILAVPVNEKLTRANYPLWSAQVLLAIRAAQLEDLILGVEKAPEKDITVVIDDKSLQQWNPTYTAWVVRDQAVLGYILSTLTRETLMHVSRCSTSAAAWRTLVDLYSSQMRARSVNTQIALATMKKLQLSITDYYAKMSTLQMSSLRLELLFVMMSSSLIFLLVWMKNTIRCSLQSSPGLIQFPQVN
jgi:hypothetical protein